YLTLYAFSTENWGRPKEEVDALMQLLVSTIKAELKTLHKNKVRLTSIGDIAKLPKGCQKEIKEAIHNTKDNDGLTLVLALNYSGRWEILEAVKAIAADVKQEKISIDDITSDSFSGYL